MTCIPLATVELPASLTSQNVYSAYRSKGIACAEHIKGSPLCPLPGKGRILELGIATVDVLAPASKISGDALSLGDLPLEPEFGGVTLSRVYEGVRKVSGKLLSSYEAFWLPMVIDAPPFRKSMGKGREGGWYRFAMPPTSPIKGSPRILCFGSDEKGPRVDENLANNVFRWAPIERFVYVISRTMSKD